MLPVADLEPNPATTLRPALPARGRRKALPFAHRQVFAIYFDGLAHHGDAAAALRRLISYLDADLEAATRVSLWHALWCCARRLPAGERDAVYACLDGRHAQALSPLMLDWHDPVLIEHLATCTQPRSRQAEFVPALLARHGADPLADPQAQRPHLLLLAVQAACWAAWPRLDADRIGMLQAAALNATERDPTLLPQGLALLFELALHAADEDTATAVLAELLWHDHADALRRERVRDWLDGTAFVGDGTDDAETRPLRLAAAWEWRWLQPVDWRQPDRLAALHQALQRPGPRRRLEKLASAWPCLPAQPAVQRPSQPAAAARPRQQEALQRLQALDSAYAAIDLGCDVATSVQPLLEPDTLAPAAIACIHRATAHALGAQGDREGQILALLQARRQQATPALRAELAAALMALHPTPTPTPAFGADWCEELPYWAGLLKQGLQVPDSARRLAAFALATLWTDGLLEPQPPRRCQRLDDAHALWCWLAEQPAYAALAQAALRQAAFTVMRPALRQRAGVEHLWFEAPGAHGVTVVFSCIATHHSYAEVTALRGRLPGQHLLFVRCPEKNWYSDETYDTVHRLLREAVLSRFAKSDVSCWYGSMGGHGALKFALEFGLRAIVFNPQTDLDLWAAFRPRERSLLWGAQHHARLADWPQPAWDAMPLYYACGSNSADREALSFVIERWRGCRHASLIVEKFDDPNHAGLMNRIAAGPVAAVLARIQQRLRQLEGPSPLTDMLPVDNADQASFWDRLDAAKAIKVELQMRDGQLWWQPSIACGTEPR